MAGIAGDDPFDGGGCDRVVWVVTSRRFFFSSGGWMMHQALEE